MLWEYFDNKKLIFSLSLSVSPYLYEQDVSSVLKSMREAGPAAVAAAVRANKKLHEEDEHALVSSVCVCVDCIDCVDCTAAVCTFPIYCRCERRTMNLRRRGR